MKIPRILFSLIIQRNSEQHRASDEHDETQTKRNRERRRARGKCERKQDKRFIKLHQIRLIAIRKDKLKAIMNSITAAL